MTDIEIARQAEKMDIQEVATSLGLKKEDYILYGNDKAKIIKTPTDRQGKLILVTAISPTPYGEGKTTVSIGLGDSFHQMKRNSIMNLRLIIMIKIT